MQSREALELWSFWLEMLSIDHEVCERMERIFGLED
jgi:hypothetical protein